MIHSRYVETPDGQLHLREWAPQSESRRPLLCLHPAPFSGLFYTTALPALGLERRVIAPDYPGYGGSPSRGATPSVEDYAVSMLQCLTALELDQGVDVLGFHSGALVGAEMQLQDPDAINALVLVDVPYFVGETRESMLRSAAAPLELDVDLSSLAALWKSGIEVKAPLMGMERAVALLAEQLRAYPHSHLAFRAAFSYPCQERFNRLPGPVSIIATQSGLLEATRACAESTPAGSFIEALDITRGVFEEGAGAITVKIDAALETMEGAQRER